MSLLGADWGSGMASVSRLVGRREAGRKDELREPGRSQVKMFRLHPEDHQEPRKILGRSMT